MPTPWLVSVSSSVSPSSPPPPAPPPAAAVRPPLQCASSTRREHGQIRAPPIRPRSPSRQRETRPLTPPSQLQPQRAVHLRAWSVHANHASHPHPDGRCDAMLPMTTTRQLPQWSLAARADGSGRAAVRSWRGVMQRCSAVRRDGVIVRMARAALCEVRRRTVVTLGHWEQRADTNKQRAASQRAHRQTAWPACTRSNRGTRRGTKEKKEKEKNNQWTKLGEQRHQECVQERRWRGPSTSSQLIASSDCFGRGHPSHRRSQRQEAWQRQPRG